MAFDFVVRVVVNVLVMLNICDRITSTFPEAQQSGLESAGYHEPNDIRQLVVAGFCMGPPAGTKETSYEFCDGAKS